jgi:NDP-sugar pyrophosphorylase family protein
LAPVHGRPYLTYLFDQLADAGLAEVMLLTGFRSEQVHGTLGDSYAGMRLIYSEEPCPLGTAGALRCALPKLSGPTILLLNGDSYCDVDLAAFHDFHKQCRADISMALARVPNAARFGRVWADSHGRVQRFEEKTVAAGSDWMNAGVYLLERKLIEQFPVGRPLSLERDLFPAWVEQLRFFAFRCAGRFLDIGTPESYAAAEFFFRSVHCFHPVPA